MVERVFVYVCERERRTFQKRCWSGIKNLLSEIKLNLIHENHGMIQDYKEIYVCRKICRILVRNF